ncbi:MAG TPA: hypothetical protein EYN54_09210 [Methylococcaceae bacterium]|nr:hypothetical protein [Methylococcaceae bacterium]
MNTHEKVTIKTISTKGVNRVKKFFSHLNNRPYFTASALGIVAAVLTFIYIKPHNRNRTLLESLDHMVVNHTSLAIGFLIFTLVAIYAASKVRGKSHAK